MDATIGLRQLAIDCIIGVRDRERVAPQRIFVDAALEVDVSGAAGSDELTDSVDYTAVARLLTEVAQQGGFRLLEGFVAAAAQRLFDEFAAVRALEIEVRKPEALAAAAHAYVRLQRRRSRDV